MKTITTFLFALFVCLSSDLNGQFIAKDILNIAPDSCLMTVSKVVTQEMILPSQEPYERELTKLKLSTQDMHILIKRASKKSSYQGDRALMDHSNVTFRFYKGNMVCSSLHLSTYTGNVEIYTSNAENQCYNRVSDKFSRYFIELLKKYEVWEMIDSFDKQGLEPLD